jgi:nitroreductase
MEVAPMEKFLPYPFVEISVEEQVKRARGFYEECARRRSIRSFSNKPVAREVLEWIIRTAGTAPSGANKQPWRFVVVTDSDLKRQIRMEAEKEERESYEQRMSEEWLEDLEPLGTDWHKEYLETAPVLIVVFALSYGIDGTRRRKHYYVKESVGIAVGFLLAAIHHAGLVSLTHTPSPMEFLGKILGRPAHERPFVLIPVGYPSDGAVVPNIQRKSLEEICEWK